MKVLVACEFSGTVRDAFLRRGHDAWSCDLEPSESSLGPHIQDDVMHHLDEGWDLMIAHPPCTYLSVVNAKSWGRKVELQDEAIRFVWHLWQADISRIAIENPVGILSKNIGFPDQYVQPYQFGHTVSKKTCLWLKNLPSLVPTSVVEPEWAIYGGWKGSRVSKWYLDSYKISNIRDRSRFRSRTFPGLAEAMADQWGGVVEEREVGRSTEIAS